MASGHHTVPCGAGLLSPAPQGTGPAAKPRKNNGKPLRTEKLFGKINGLKRTGSGGNRPYRTYCRKARNRCSRMLPP